MNTLRKYLTSEEYEQLTGLTADTDFLTKVARAESVIDNFVGFHEKFFSYEIAGAVQGASEDSLFLESLHSTSNYKDFYKYCVVEIVGGKGEGQKRVILSSDTDGKIKVDHWDTDKTPDQTSYYKIYQLGKFPRKQDITYGSGILVYFKVIPEKIKLAVAQQIIYMDTMGSDFFNTNKADLNSESIGDYSFTKSNSGSGVSGDQLVAPMARQTLHGIVSRMGRIVE